MISQGKFFIPLDIEGSSSNTLLVNTAMHAKVVHDLMHYYLRKCVGPDVASHDWSKFAYKDLFVSAVQQKLAGVKKSKIQRKWLKKHHALEKHHARDYTGDEPIMLGDILHMLCDWVAAGTARGGFEYVELNEDIMPLLLLATKNTFRWLVDNTRVATVAETERLAKLGDSMLNQIKEVNNNEV